MPGWLKDHRHEPRVLDVPGVLVALVVLPDVCTETLVNCRATLDDLLCGVPLELGAIVCVAEARCLRNVAEVDEGVYGSSQGLPDH